MSYESGTVAYIQWANDVNVLGGIAGSRCRCICSSEQREDVMAAVLKVGLHVGLWRYTNRWVFTWWIILLIWSDLKRRSLGLFEERLPPKNKKNKNKMSSDMRSVPDPKMTHTTSGSDWCIYYIRTCSCCRVSVYRACFCKRGSYYITRVYPICRISVGRDGQKHLCPRTKK